VGEREGPGGKAEKSFKDSFTSGGRTSIALWRASATWRTTLSVFEASLEMSAAMNSTGWWALSQAVWTVRRPYAAECDLLKPYAANFSMRSKMPLATLSSTPRARAPSRKPTRSFAISSAFFFPIARRRRSARPRL
jgi:hypothetical protein